MRVSSVLIAVVTLVLVISLLCIWFYPSIQDFMASNTMWNGIKSFSSEFGAENIDSLDDLPDLPGETALVSIPYLEFSDDELAKIKRFVSDGGTLLLMDDYGYGNSVLAYLGASVRFSNEPLLDPLFCYENQWLPKVMDFSPSVAESGINVIVLNHATAMTNAIASETIAWSSASSFSDTNENGSWDQGEPKGSLPVAVQFRLGQGRVAVASDPCILMNSMVGRDDNYSFVQYLISQNGEQMSILIDNSHLAEAPLDISKKGLASGREMLSSPYALVGVMALVFIAVSRLTLRKGETLD
ncbi:MAG: hypothetical protein KAI14_05360 [Dehalococcoidales bacterium]|nr:hypothetical protein [Dehalococcoidales bacterium]